MAAAALVVAAIVVGAPADAAVTADAAPRDLRPVQECADLAAWLAHRRDVIPVIAAAHGVEVYEGLT